MGMMPSGEKLSKGVLSHELMNISRTRDGRAVIQEFGVPVYKVKSSEWDPEN